MIQLKNEVEANGWLRVYAEVLAKSNPVNVTKCRDRAANEADEAIKRMRERQPR